MRKFIFMVLAALLLLGCSFFKSSIYIENDQVMKSRRIIYDAYFTKNKSYEQYYSQHLTFLKETDKNQHSVFTVYDVVTLPSESFDINEEKLFIIIDEDVIPMPTTFVKQFNTRKINEKKDEIMKSDSTKISVVTGYDEINRKSIQMTHVLPDEITDKINHARIVNFRYYIGASYINTEIKGRNLENLKKMIRE